MGGLNVWDGDVILTLGKRSEVQTTDPEGVRTVNLLSRRWNAGVGW